MGLGISFQFHSYNLEKRKVRPEAENNFPKLERGSGDESPIDPLPCPTIPPEK